MRLFGDLLRVPMLILKTLGFAFLVSGATIIIMFMWLAFNSKAFFDMQSPRYYEVTTGNPLNAAFDDGLLTERGLRWRALIGKVQIFIWSGFAAVAFVESLFVM